MVIQFLDQNLNRSVMMFDKILVHRLRLVVPKINFMQ